MRRVIVGEIIKMITVGMIVGGMGIVIIKVMVVMWGTS